MAAGGGRASGKGNRARAEDFWGVVEEDFIDDARGECRPVYGGAAFDEDACHLELPQTLQD